MAKLGFDGEWDWVKFLHADAYESVSMFLWSESAIAISGEGIYRDELNGIYTDFAVFSTTGEVIESFKLEDN